MADVSAVLAVGAVLLGATLQRATGLGFTLVAGPFLTVLLGPFTGVVLANLLSAAVSLVVLAATYRAFEGRIALRLLAGSVVAVPLGALVVYLLPGPVLLLTIGLITAGSVAWVAAGNPIRILRSSPGAPVAGFVSGFCNVTAGTGGPPLAVYAVSTGWGQVGFIPTVQAVGLASNVLSLAVKGWPGLRWPLLAACGAAVVVGIVAGQYLTRAVTEATARRWVIGLALTGSTVAVLKGVWTLW